MRWGRIGDALGMHWGRKKMERIERLKDFSLVSNFFLPRPLEWSGPKSDFLVVALLGFE